MGAEERSTRSGRPFSPPPDARATPDGRGGKVYAARNGTEFRTDRAGRLTQLRTQRGSEARFNDHGRVSTIHAGTLTINHGFHGGRTVVTRTQGGVRVVGMGRHHGFVEHPFVRGDRTYLRRTYVYGGRSYAVVYRNCYYGGVPYYAYVPRVYYAPAFYGWAAAPFVAPVVWGWPWAADPWYGYYGAYFAPAPVYPYPALWLTDFLLAESLRSAYEAREAAAYADAEPYAEPPPPEPSPYASDADEPPAARPHRYARAAASTLTPEVKQAIAEEVKVQIAAQQAAASRPEQIVASNEQAPEALDPKFRTFIVSRTLSAPTDDGGACSLSAGDVLTRIANKPDADQNVTMLVTSSQPNDCETGTQLPVSLQDLQDMHNDFREKIDAGLRTLADNEGKNGMASGPAPDQRPSEEGQAQPDSDASQLLDQQRAAADGAEADVRQSE